MLLDFLGGALEVGASSVFLQIDGKNILLDSGIRQSSSKDNIPNFRSIQEHKGIDAIIISHAHLDHIGCLPIISKEYPNARIYMNNMTKDLVRVLLYDSLKIMNNRDSEIPLYAEKDVMDTLDRVFTINYEVKFPIFDDIYITLYNSGHIAGASSIYIQGKEGSVLYSGDFSAFSQRTVEGAKIPKLRPDVAIIESTYGDKLHSNRDIEEATLIDLVNECIENNGKMIIPAFALGRAQEVLLILKGAINRGRLKKVNIYVDGMVRDINRVYRNNPLYLKNSLGKKILQGKEPFYNENIIEIKNTDSRDEILNKNEPAVIVSSSGMLTGGPSAYYAEKIACMENGYIAITGYQDEESPGRKVLDLLEETEEEKYLNINNLNIPLKCKIKKIGLSAHGDKSEIKGLIQKLTPKNIFLVHGNEEVIKSLSQEISKEYIGKVYSPRCGESFKIQIRNPRKQWNKEFRYILSNKKALNEKELWQFINDNYEDKLFTIEELIYIWTGKNTFDQEKIKEFKDLILNSIYFESDMRRLFLFKRRTKCDIDDLLKPKEMTQQELLKIVEDKFKVYNYKKVSFITDKKEIVLNFDFPKSIDKSINDIIEEFNSNNSWKVVINNKINNNAVGALIREYIDISNIKRISFYPEKSTVNIMLNTEISDLEKVVEIIKCKTGLNIIIGEKNTECNSTISCTDNNTDKRFFEGSSYNTLEQNEALYYIDMAFKEEKYKPYKKSIKNNDKGKYIECSFITPKIGDLYAEKLSGLCRDIGWNLRISDKVNQNEILNIAINLCSKYGIDLKKNPSYNGSDMSVTLNILKNEQKFSDIKEEFKERTGCEINYK